MAAVQFYGKEQVMEAAAQMKGCAWAIFSGTALFMKFETGDATESEQALEQALDMLDRSGTSAVYKIKFFEIPEGKTTIKINEKTVCDGGSFSFKNETQQNTIQQYGIRGVAMTEANAKLDKLLAIVEAQQQRLDELEEGGNDDEDEKDKSISGLIMGAVDEAIKDPNKLMQWANTFKAITGIGMNKLQNNFMGAIGNIPAAAQPEPTMQTLQIDPSSPGYQARVQRMCAAVDVLEKADPLFVEHLEKLAEMAQNNPSQFNWLIKML